MHTRRHHVDPGRVESLMERDHPGVVETCALESPGGCLTEHMAQARDDARLWQEHVGQKLDLPAVWQTNAFDRELTVPTFTPSAESVYGLPIERFADIVQ